MMMKNLILTGMAVAAAITFTTPIVAHAYTPGQCVGETGKRPDLRRQCLSSVPSRQRVREVFDRSGGACLQGVPRRSGGTSYTTASSCTTANNNKR
jgi:hypothetical protein